MDTFWGLIWMAVTQVYISVCVHKFIKLYTSDLCTSLLWVILQWKSTSVQRNRVILRLQKGRVSSSKQQEAMRTNCAAVYKKKAALFRTSTQWGIPIFQALKASHKAGESGNGKKCVSHLPKPRNQSHKTHNMWCYTAQNIYRLTGIHGQAWETHSNSVNKKVLLFPHRFHTLPVRGLEMALRPIFVFSFLIALVSTSRIISSNRGTGCYFQCLTH